MLKMSLGGQQRIVLFYLVVFVCVFAFEDIPQDIVPVLYDKYKEAVDDALDDNSMSLRRIFKHKKEYKIHVKKLKEVNGFKRHNLILRSDMGGKPLVYINNPVETKIPNAYLSLDEFKQLLTDRVNRQREKFQAYNQPKPSIIVPTRTTLKNIQVINSTKKSNRFINTSTNNKQSNIERYNRPPIRNTKKLVKPEYETTITIETSIFLNPKYIGNDVDSTMDTKNNVNKITTDINKTVLNVNETTTARDEDSSDPVTTLESTSSPTELIETTTHEREVSTSELPISNINIETSRVTEPETTETKTTTMSTTTMTTKATRRTLSRPLVFMGGYN